MEARLQKWGNSLACRIPHSLSKECGLTDKCKVEITTSDGKIVIFRAASLPIYSLDELVSRITPENKHDYADTDFGEPVGLEIL